MSKMELSFTEALVASQPAFGAVKTLLDAKQVELADYPKHLLQPFALFALSILARDPGAFARLLKNMQLYHQMLEKELQTLFFYASKVRVSPDDLATLCSKIDTAAFYEVGTNSPAAYSIYHTHEIGSRTTQHDGFLISQKNDGLLLGVFDGVGEHVESGIIVQQLKRELSLLNSVTLESVRIALHKVQTQILERRAQQPSLPGSTLSIFVILNNGQSYSINIGDSRQLILVNGEWYVTASHLDSKQAITQAIGHPKTFLDETNFDSFVMNFPTQPERLYLITDGLQYSDKFIGPTDILTDPTIPGSLKLVVINILNGMYTSYMSDNRTGIYAELHQ